MTHTSTHRMEADGVTVFYREAGALEAPVVLLLHGFPASSFQYRELIPLLADKYHVIAPDLPGFGFTVVPEARQYEYTFDALARTMLAFTDAMGLNRFALYVFDYGAPTGFRMAMARPESITAIVSQNGNAYEEGLGNAWAPIQRYWKDPSIENREVLRQALNPEGLRSQYTDGVPNPERISPEGYTLDAAMIARPGNMDIQLDLFLDYANNVKLYPAFQEYFRKWKPPLLAIWGKYDPFFIPAGAAAFPRDNPNATVQMLNTGHFALETHVEEIASAMKVFLDQPRLEEYDLVILGTGEGSKYLAWTLGKKERVAVIERQYIGGSCPNIACLPSKNVIHSAKVASYFQRSEEFGINKENYSVDMAAVRDRKRKMVAGLVDMHLDNFKKSGSELIRGSGRFIGPGTIEVSLPDGTKRRIHGSKVIIGTGTHATLDPIPGLAESKPLTHIEALELDELPEHLLVLGGGYVGLELAQAMRRFGSKVTVIDRNARVASREDEDVSDAIRDLFHDEGIDLVLNARVSSVSGESGRSVRVMLEESEKSVEGTHLLVATGRTPNTAGTGLELAGVELTERGYIKVNARLETTATGVWAIGECAGSPQFTHIAYDDFRVIRDNLAGGNRVTTGRQVPYCLFTDPELARIGLNEREAKAQGIPYRLAKLPMSLVLRTRTLSETRGFMKALIATDSDRILGFTVFGEGAGEIMGSVQIAMIAGLPYTALRDAVLTHPTLLEGLVSLFSTIVSAPKSVGAALQ